MIKLDPRRHAYRADLADAALKEKVRAQRYAEGEVRQICAPQIAVRAAPRFDAPLLTEALHGEYLTVFDAQEGWAWVQLRDDSYVGYAPLDGLSTLPEEPTHKVAARLTYVYPAPDIKQPPFMRLSFSSRVSVASNVDGKLWELTRGGYVFGDHIVGFRERARDFVRVAERMVGTPYLWGGKSALGIDCSGLVQLSLQAAGAFCPRDSDMQMEEVGEAIDSAQLDSIQRGDLLFWKGHVGIAQSADWMVHASGAHMEVVVEPVRRAIERIGESYGPLVAIKRPVIETARMRNRPAEPAKVPPPEKAEASPVPSTEAAKAELAPMMMRMQKPTPAQAGASASVQPATDKEQTPPAKPADKPAEAAPVSAPQASLVHGGPSRMRRGFHNRGTGQTSDAAKPEGGSSPAQETSARPVPAEPAAKP
jgi:cell wall-associated NlpC family hydrolase